MKKDACAQRHTPCPRNGSIQSLPSSFLHSCCLVGQPGEPAGCRHVCATFQLVPHNQPFQPLPPLTQSHCLAGQPGWLAGCRHFYAVLQLLPRNHPIQSLDPHSCCLAGEPGQLAGCRHVCAALQLLSWRPCRPLASASCAVPRSFAQKRCRQLANDLQRARDPHFMSNPLHPSDPQGTRKRCSMCSCTSTLLQQLAFSFAFRLVCAAKGSTAATLLDTKGPEIRTAMLRDHKPISLEAGQSIIVEAVGAKYMEFEGYKEEGGETRIGLSYDKLCQSVKPGNLILLADGSISIRVDEIVSDRELRGTVLNSKSLGERKNCNLPGVKVEIPVLTEKDVNDLQNFAAKHKMDFVAASFVQTKEDVLFIRSVLDKAGGHSVSALDGAGLLPLIGETP
eukprot:361554-Pelagomonas_calceolata.AAC.4